MTDADNVMNHNILGQIRQTSGSGLIRQSGFESRIVLGWTFGIGGGLRSLSTVLLTLYLSEI